MVLPTDSQLNKRLYLCISSARRALDTATAVAHITPFVSCPKTNTAFHGFIHFLHVPTAITPTTWVRSITAAYVTLYISNCFTVMTWLYICSVWNFECSFTVSKHFWRLDIYVPWLRGYAVHRAVNWLTSVRLKVPLCCSGLTKTSRE